MPALKHVQKQSTFFLVIRVSKGGGGELKGGGESMGRGPGLQSL